MAESAHADRLTREWHAGCFVRPVLRITVLLLLGLTGCFAHEASGDAAAARGDWTSAITEYDTAIEWNLDSPELRNKRWHAHRQAVATAPWRARACGRSKDWRSCLPESEYALRVDPGSSEARALFTLVSQIITRSKAADDPELKAAVQTTTLEAQQLGTSRKFAEAEALLLLVVQADETTAPILGDLRKAALAMKVDQTMRRARACAESRDWKCCLVESEAALRLDPADAEARVLSGLVSRVLTPAKSASGLELAGLVEDAKAQARRLGPERITEARALVELIVAVDPGQAQLGTELQVAYERFLTEQAADQERSLREQAAGLWKAKCASCHGEDGRAHTRMGERRQMNDMTAKAWQSSRSDESIRQVIVAGVPGTPMRAFLGRISARDIAGLTRHVRNYRGSGN